MATAKIQTANVNGLNGGAATTIISTNTPGITVSSSSTVEYNGTAAQAGTSVGTGYAGNLLISNTAGAVTFAAACTVGGTTTVNAGAILATGGLFTTTGTAIIAGILQLNTGGSISAAPTYSGTTSALIYNPGCSSQYRS